jgi:hypothetical protein
MGKLHFVESPDFGSDTTKRYSAGNVFERHSPAGFIPIWPPLRLLTCAGWIGLCRGVGPSATIQFNCCSNATDFELERV